MQEWNVWIGTNGDSPAMATTLRELPGTGVRVDEIILLLEREWEEEKDER